MKEHILHSLNQSQKILAEFVGDDKNITTIESAASAMVDSLQKGGTVFSCGNGGSMSDAMHFAEELSGRFRDNRKGLSGISISDPTHITCVANDFGFEHIFSRYLEANAKSGDCLLAITTSGNSENVLKAAEYAKNNGITVIGLTGVAGSKMTGLADIEISVGRSDYSDRVQELHIKVIHILIELIERSHFPENY